MPALTLPTRKTKIVGTIGPASQSPEVMRALIRAGLNVARLNFSHGDFDSHGRAIRNLRAAAREEGCDIAIMADLPGPKMRIGRLAEEPIELKLGDPFTLTVAQVVGDTGRASVNFEPLPRVVRPGDALFLNDGLVRLEVVEVQGEEVRCRVVAGGELSSRKGLNLPGIDLGISAFTPRDRECLQFALEQGVDAVSQSFVESAADVIAVRQAARELGYHPFILAKIERSRALDHVGEILDAADGIMIARGDLGVEVPIWRIAVLQKQLIRKALWLGKPVITATQMLESMTHSRQPTRAEVTDVANAILDGTDCVMLSGESAMGRYPVEAVSTLARIGAATEPHRSRTDVWEALKKLPSDRTYSVRDSIGLSIKAIFGLTTPAAVVVPTRSGATARSITRFRLPVWLAAASANSAVCRCLHFSYGVIPMQVTEEPVTWGAFARQWIQERGLAGPMALLIQGPSDQHPEANHQIQFLELDHAQDRAPCS